MAVSVKKICHILSSYGKLTYSCDQRGQKEMDKVGGKCEEGVMTEMVHC